MIATCAHSACKKIVDTNKYSMVMNLFVFRQAINCEISEIESCNVFNDLTFVDMQATRPGDWEFLTLFNPTSNMYSRCDSCKVIFGKLLKHRLDDTVVVANAFVWLKQFCEHNPNLTFFVFLRVPTVELLITFVNRHKKDKPDPPMHPYYETFKPPTCLRLWFYFVQLMDSSEIGPEDEAKVLLLEESLKECFNVCNVLEKHTPTTTVKLLTGLFQCKVPTQKRKDYLPPTTTEEESSQESSESSQPSSTAMSSSKPKPVSKHTTVKRRQDTKKTDSV
eukprot:Platyproteum_vivax@DN7667_c0_g1_i4.p1